MPSIIWKTYWSSTSWLYIYKHFLQMTTTAYVHFRYIYLSIHHKWWQHHKLVIHAETLQMTSQVGYTCGNITNDITSWLYIFRHITNDNIISWLYMSKHIHMRAHTPHPRCRISCFCFSNTFSLDRLSIIFSILIFPHLNLKKASGTAIHSRKYHMCSETRLLCDKVKHLFFLIILILALKLWKCLQ